MRVSLVLLFIIPLMSIGQVNQDSTSSKFQIGISCSPNHTYRVLKYDSDLQIFVEAREKNEQSSTGFNAGANVTYGLSKKIELVIGVQYARYAHEFSNLPIVTTMGTVSGVADNNQRYHYIEIPFRANYHFFDQRFFTYISAGVSVNQFLNDNSITTISYSNGEKETIKSGSGILDINKTTFGGLGGLGIGYHIKNKINLRLEPLLRYTLTPLAEAPIKQHNYSIGGQIGINLVL